MNYKKTLFKPLLISLLFVMFSSLTIAQTKPVKFRHLTTRDGLSQNRIFDIVQDHDGFIWIGTEDGLNRYDGYKFEIFKRIPGDTASISDNFASVLYVSKDGTLWSGGDFGGLSRYDAQSKSFTSYTHAHSDPNSITDNNINSISEDEKGNLWIGTNNGGFDYMFVDKGKFIHMQNMLPKGYPLNYGEIIFLYQDRTNHLWIGSESKIHYFKIDYNNLDIPQLQPVQLKNQNIGTAAVSIEEASSGRIWIGTFSQGILEFDRDNLSLNQLKFKNEESAILSTSIQSIETDANGNLWFGGRARFFNDNNTFNAYQSSLYKMELSSGDVQKYSHDTKDENSLSSNIILSLFCDNTGVMWIGTNLGGVNIYDESITKFSIFVADPSEETQLSSPTRGFYLEEGNILWIASQGDGLVSYDRKNGKFDLYKYDVNDPNSISSNFVQSLYNDGEYLWVGTFRGLNRFDKKTKKFKRVLEREQGFNFGISYNILEISKFPDYLWFGTSGEGLFKFNKKDFTYKNYKYDPEVDNGLNNRANFVRTVWYSEKRPNELWIGTTNGINILDFETEKFRYYNHDPNDSTSLSHPNVMHFYEDESGYIWVATYGGGLNRFDPKTKKFIRFTEGNSDLPNNGVYGSLPDKEGNLWISTNNGITKFDPVNFSFRNYSVDDGLQSEEFNGGSYFLGYNGEMFFGGISGFNSFFPEEVIDNKFIPKIVITDLKIFNESVGVGRNSPLKQEISKTDEIDLEYWQNDISFEYVALHFSNPSKNKYAFKLENYENEWRYVNNIRVATYTNLDPGEYTFRVKGSNNDGLWNEEGKSIKLVIHPPWWKSNLAYVSYAFLFLFGLFSVDRYQKVRIKRIEQRKAQLALLQAENNRKTEELEEARNLQLSMLPKSLPQMPHLDIAVYMKTATEVGGDYYDFHVGLDGTLTVVIGDATGHGLRAGTMVTSIKSLFSSLANQDDIAKTFHEMTRCIKKMHFDKLLMSFTMLKINGSSLQMSAGGMPPVYIHHAANDSVDEFEFNGMPLGTIDKFPYEVKDLNLEKGDTILLTSDGFPELQNLNKEQYGYKRLKNKFGEIANNSTEMIIDLLKKESAYWLYDNEQDDDVTFVIIKVK